MSEVRGAINQSMVLDLKNDYMQLSDQIIFGKNTHQNYAQSGIVTCSVLLKRVDGFEKIIKNSQRLIELNSILGFLVSNSFATLSKGFKNTIDLFDSVKFVGMVQLFVCPQKNGKYFFIDTKNSVYKKIDRVLLAAHLTCKTARILKKWNLIELGKIATTKIGTHLGIFHLITDGCMSLSCIFNILDTSLKIQEYPNKKLKIEKKLNKWKERSSLPHLMAEEDKGAIEPFRQKWLETLKIKRKNHEKAKHEFNLFPSNENRNKLVKLQDSCKKLDKRLTYSEQGYYKALFKSLSKIDCADKIKEITFQKELLKTERQISWIKIAASVSKIFVITLALAFTVLNAVSILPVATLLACGFIADSIGLIRIVAEQNMKNRQKNGYHLYLQNIP